MSHDVFVSYTHQDKSIADAVCSGLEHARIRCWIAPRDILPGSEWGESIVNAISGCSLMVVVFSAHANASKQVLREVERCVSRGIILVPLRVEDVAPSGSMEYFLGTPHWLDALTPPLEAHIARLVDTIQRILKAAPVSTANSETASKPMPSVASPARSTHESPDAEIALIRARMLQTASVSELRHQLYRVEELRGRHSLHPGLRDLHDQLQSAIAFATAATPATRPPRAGSSEGGERPRWAGRRIFAVGATVVAAVLAIQSVQSRQTTRSSPRVGGPQDSTAVVGLPSNADSTRPLPGQVHAVSGPPDSVVAPRKSGRGSVEDPPLAYFDSQVDKQVAPYPGNPPPAYPAMLRASNIEGEVLLQFVVDTTGRAEMRTVKVLKSTHQLFTDAVKASLPEMRFHPAEIRGRPVRGLVQMPFQFSLTKNP